MNKLNCFVIERMNQHEKEYLAATRQVWVQERGHAYHFSNIEDAQRYQAGYTSAEPNSRIVEYPWPELSLGR